MTTHATSSAPGLQRGPVAPPAADVIVGYLLVAWCLGFAGVSAWQLATGWSATHGYGVHASGIAVMIVVVLVLKLVGAVVAWRATRPHERASWWLGASLWGAASLLVLYSAGNVVITVGMVSGLTETSGGVDARMVAYVAFFLVPAPLFAMLALSYQRRMRPSLTAFVVGAAGAPVLLATVLAGLPAVLSAGGWLP